MFLDPQRRFGPAIFVLALAGLAALPLVPETVLAIQNHAGLKSAAPILYYEAIVSFVLLVPALLLPKRLARIWVVAMAVLMGGATVIVGFYSVTNGARWNLTAHTALMQTNRAEAWSYLTSFGSWMRLGSVALIGAGFVGCAIVNLRAQRPSRRWAALLIVTGLLGGGYGLRNIARYGADPIRPVNVVGQAPIRIFGIGIDLYHPLTIFAATHYNFRATQHYYLERYREAASHFGRLEGATPLPNATSPRIIVIVVGESASRRHWSLYGYKRPTTPKLQQLSSELAVFSDVISTGTGTLGSIRGMFTTTEGSAPVFHLFSSAGYKTHRISSQYNQGFDDLELSALVGSCDERIFLSGAYDENLVPLLTKAVAEPGRHLVFLNLMGSHVRYRDRYPAREDIFPGKSEAEELLATYDNSIHYTDEVLADFIQTLRVCEESSCLLYVSDHAEDVFDSRPDKYLFRDDSIATNAMYEVPFVVWCSDRYRRENAAFVQDGINAGIGRPFQNRALYHSILSLARLTHPLYHSEQDLFSSGFKPKERRVGGAGRIYRGDR